MCRGPPVDADHHLTDAFWLHLHFAFFFFNDTATTEIYTVSYTLSLHDALPIFRPRRTPHLGKICNSWSFSRSEEHTSELQSQLTISYAVFCLKKKNKIKITQSIIRHILKIFNYSYLKLV